MSISRSKRQILVVFGYTIDSSILRAKQFSERNLSRKSQHIS